MERRLVLIVSLFALLLASPSSVWAGGTHGIFNVVKGDVKVKSGKTGKIKKAKIGSKIFPKDTVITGKDSRAKVVMVDKNVLNISPQSQIVLQKYEYEPKAKKKNVLLNVIYGKVRSKVEQKYDGKSSKFQVKTPSAVAGVRGTDFLASYKPSTKASNVITFEGKVSFGLPGPKGKILNPVSVGVGQVAKSVSGNVPEPPKSMPKSQLAKMDKESNADTAPAKSQDARTPADQNNKKDEKIRIKNLMMDQQAKKPKPVRAIKRQTLVIKKRREKKIARKRWLEKMKSQQTNLKPVQNLQIKKEMAKQALTRGIPLESLALKVIKNQDHLPLAVNKPAMMVAVALHQRVP